MCVVVPILAWSFQLFKEVLSFPDRRLLIIGYGFRDSHINKAIVTLILEKNLKIFIINPTDPGDFHTGTLAGVETKRDLIWEPVAGYYPYTLAEFFPAGTSPTQIYKNFEIDF